VVRSQTLVTAAAVFAWIAALAGMLALAWGARLPHWTSAAAAIYSVAAIVYSSLLISQRLKPPPSDMTPGLVAIALAPATWLAAASGGASSPAILCLALGARALAGSEDIRTAVAVAVGSLVTISVIDLSVGGSVTITETLVGAALFAAIAVFPAWQVKRIHETNRQRRRASSSLYDSVRTASGGPREAVPSDLRRGIEASRQEAEERRQTEVLGRYLGDVRDSLGADEVIFWRWTATRDTLVAAACSTSDEPEPTKFRFAEWLPLVKWSAEERIVHFDTAENAPQLAIGPVVGTKAAFGSIGAISISADGGLRASRDDLREWLPRHASHAALLAELLHTREEFARQNRRTQALLEAARDMQQNRSLDALGRAVCEKALEVTSATRAALIRWKADSNDGEVQAVSEGHPVTQGWPISEDSHVGTMCRNGLPQVWEDARLVARNSRIYGSWETPRTIGSLGIIPLKPDSGVIGAIVIEGDEPGDVMIAEVRNLRLLGVMAAASLESLWEIEEVTRRARTDQLTGLANRRHFDEELTRVLAETDRFGGHTSLVVADIDFFKNVNDTHGHDGGDAVLRQIAQTFQDGVRQVDLCARYGGEEIAVLLRQTDANGAREFAERLRKAIETRPVRYQGREIRVTASFGVSCYPETARSHDALFPSADRALYQAKAEGRNRVRSALPIPVQKIT
jgi:diguanylate cyclase (GGDEF)-like protein